jgi:pimeloyl-ACP methyl ester carboxylesterase
VTTDGVEIATYDLGGSGPPLLLVHATGLHGRVWLPFAARLNHRFHCYAFDSRGHGLSGKAPADDYDWWAMARDVTAVCHGLGLRDVYAVGHSCGGALVLMAEACVPGTFRALYCYEPVVAPIERHLGKLPDHLLEMNPFAAAAHGRMEVLESRDAAYIRYRAKAPFSTFDASALSAYLEWGFEDLPDGTVRLRCRRDDEARIHEVALFHGAFFELGRVCCPVTLACGDGADAYFTPATIEVIASRLVSVSIDALRGLGHFGPLEEPEEVGRSILRAFGGAAPAMRQEGVRH